MRLDLLANGVENRQRNTSRDVFVAHSPNEKIHGTMSRIAFLGAVAVGLSTLGTGHGQGSRTHVGKLFNLVPDAGAFGLQPF